MKRTRTVFRVYPLGYEMLELYQTRYSRRRAFKLAMKLGDGTTVRPYRRIRGVDGEYPTDHWWEIVP
jgi:hypothetical protein